MTIVGKINGDQATVYLYLKFLELTPELQHINTDLGLVFMCV